jgi:NAD(P)-dependent dehydrogenase (short-subunit alcohol dehydrogenase family)
MTMPGQRLLGKVVIVTGSGRGIGREIALSFAREGANLVVADINPEMARAVAGEIISGGGHALPVAVDVSDSAQVSSLVDRALEISSQIDVLVNNAGIGHVKDFLSITLGEWNQVLKVNLTGVFLCGQAVARIMASQGGGRIVNVASISGERGGTGRAAYGAAKAGVILMTKVMAVELAAAGIAVNAVSPGPTETDQVREFHDDATRKAYYATLPMKRYAQPAEIAQAALFLATEEASYVTGHILNVDGGFGAAGLMSDPR